MLKSLSRVEGMTLTIDLSPESLRRLQISASIKGINVKDVVEQIVERSVPTLDEAAAPLREAISRSGLSEYEAEEFFDELLNEVRLEKRMADQ
jgi:UDP-3-O-acyl-N-acetylglucosamine deacetylase